MAGEKRFRTSVFGFKKSDVNLYIEKMLKEFDDRLKEKDNEINNIRNQLREYKSKYEDINRKYEEIGNEQKKIALALITAQENAKNILDDAKNKALEEKKRMDKLIEEEKEKLVDMRGDFMELKSKIIGILSKYDRQLGDVVDEIDENINNIDREINDDLNNDIINDRIA